MNDKKRQKKARGRHAPGAVSETTETPVSPGAPSAHVDEAEKAPAPAPEAAAEATQATRAAQAAPQPGQSGRIGPADTVIMPAAEMPPAKTGGIRPVQMNRTGGPAVGPGAPGGPVPAPAGPMRPIDVQAAEKSRRPLKVLGIIVGVIAGLAAIAYVAGAVYFMGRFWPGTMVGDFDISLKSGDEVQAILEDAIDDYTLTIDGQGFSMKLTAADAGYTLDGKTVVDSMLSDVNPWAWPVEIMRDHDESQKLAASYSESGLGDKIRAEVDAFNATATPPTDATIVYSSAKDQFVVEPEAVGTALDADAVIKAADDALIAMQPSVKLTKNELQQPKVLSTEPALKTAADKANTMITANLELVMAGTVAGAVNADTVSQWIRLGDDLTATLDENELVAWVDQLAGGCNTYGGERTYTRPDGKVCTVSGGTYGWIVDKETLLGIVKDAVAEGRTGSIDIPCTQTGNAFNGVGKQDWGNRYVDVDLSEQYARFYDDSGALVWETDIISGVPSGGEKDTPTGVYVVNSMANPSTLYTYEKGKEKPNETVVQYWMPFVGNTVGLHDAWWQPGFGGTMYQDGYGSHGCVNLPSSKAAELYGMIKVGDVVVSHW